jgi:predicted alpha/beta superfamily hydrolase
MKYSFGLLLFLVCGLAFSQQIEKVMLDSKVFNEKRTIWVSLPAAYFSEPNRKFETIYIFDAQGLEYFDQVHSAIRFVNSDVPMMVVGVVASFSEEKKQNRNTDFLPPPDFEETKKGYRYTGNTENFMAFIGSELMPYIDANYRTLPFRIGIGHSNAGTFLAHTLLKKPELFDALLLISPNFQYDKQQLVRRFESLDPKTLTQKYVFMCHANEKDGWAEAHENMRSILERPEFQAQIHFSHRDFSATENHNTVFPLGLFYGLRDFFDYQYGNSTNLIAYHEKLEKQGFRTDSDSMNMMAYRFFWDSKTDEALSIINWAIGKYSKDANLYDSQGEFYENRGNFKDAAKSYAAAMNVLKSQKQITNPKTYEEKYSFYKGNMERVNKQL